ncbi:50S ribosomal protein L24 [Porphyromonas macacae]|uniref:Large ribosomal subunit protein uL24 n=1 Tax=Porphyromonas macacae TaxID=28115 RepID=A0A0A2E0K1_9PORP|nr:50S ribosomal protein L24 [Porphyromonas macacae]KGN72423.1 50S ribosomal protein L24 [Porphyromonas macacae]KGN98715.1 50S ribosomal protein L24 [Porphyromonas macacae]SUB77074.1 50S ribosomal protein L24 [Porphyromonas macacae]SUB88546.1 50S ribosomal protein L24 [Porphyromonas macacae]
MSKLHIKKGDTVFVNSGEDKGKTGRVLEVLVKEQRAIVEGVNIIKKHTKPSAQHPDGGIVEKEASIHISNLNVVDPKTGKPTRIGRREDKNGKLFRFSKKSGEEIK